jgi:hypothetical protein
MRAWEEWNRRCQLSTIDEGGYALLPQLYQRLRRLDIPESSLLKLKGIYRHTWCHNHAMMARVTDVISRLRRCGIDCLLLSEAALMMTRDFGTLPLRKSDFLVPANQFSRATAFFRSEGWAQWSDYEETKPRLTQYINFTHDGTTCSIYPSLFSGWDASWGDEDCWLHADTYAFQNTTVRTLCPADQLLMLLLNIGLGYRPLSPRTAADIGTLLQGSTGRIDWNRFRRKIARLYVTLPIKRAFAELSAQSLMTLPVDLSSVASLETTWAENQEGGSGNRRAAPIRIARSLAHHWCRYRRGKMKGGSITGFMNYLQDSWRVRAFWALPLVAMRKLGRHIQQTH